MDHQNSFTCTVAATFGAPQARWESNNLNPWRRSSGGHTVWLLGLQFKDAWKSREGLHIWPNRYCQFSWEMFKLKIACSNFLLMLKCASLTTFALIKRSARLGAKYNVHYSFFFSAFRKGGKGGRGWNTCNFDGLVAPSWVMIAVGFIIRQVRVVMTRRELLG